MNPGSGMCKACIAGFTPRYVFPLVVGRPAGRSVWTRRTILCLASFTGVDAPRAEVLFFVVRPKMLGIMAGMTQVNRGLEEYLKNWVLLGNDVICFRIQLAGSTVDTDLCQSAEAWFLAQNCSKLRKFRSCSSSMVVDFPVVAQVHIPLVRLPLRFSTCSTLIRWSSSFVQVLFLGADVEETAELPQLQLVVVLV